MTDLFDFDPPYRDRVGAGQTLAEALRPYRRKKPIVLGLPRGGVVVAKEVALALDAPLDVIVTRKLGAPGQPELAVGAVGPGDAIYVDPRYSWNQQQLVEVAARERAEMERRTKLYRGTEGLPDVKGRVVLLVDDGIATGLTALAAVHALRGSELRRLVLAVPVCPHDIADRFEEEVDDLVCPLFPDDFFAVGVWYKNFDPVSDDEVLACLAEVRERRKNADRTQDSRSDERRSG